MHRHSGYTLFPMTSFDLQWRSTKSGFAGILPSSWDKSQSKRIQPSQKIAVGMMQFIRRLIRIGSSIRRSV